MSADAKLWAHPVAALRPWWGWASSPRRRSCSGSSQCPWPGECSAPGRPRAGRPYSECVDHPCGGGDSFQVCVTLVLMDIKSEFIFDQTDYRCQHNTRTAPKPGRVSKNTRCPAKLKVTLMRAVDSCGKPSRSQTHKKQLLKAHFPLIHWWFYQCVTVFVFLLLQKHWSTFTRLPNTGRNQQHPQS